MFQNCSGTPSAGRTYSPGSMVSTMPGRSTRLGRLVMVSPESGSLRWLAWPTSPGST